MQTQINRWLTSLHIPLVGAATNVDLRGAAGVSLPTFVILNFPDAAIAQLGERQTEDLKVLGSIPGLCILSRSCLGVHLVSGPGFVMFGYRSLSGTM